MFFARVIVLFLAISFSLATGVNVTIDDLFGDPVTGVRITYAPPGAWNSRSRSNGCPTCTAGVSDNRPYMGTWHDGTFDPLPGRTTFPNTPLVASVQFNGSAVYVFCVISESRGRPIGTSNMFFYIDSVEVGTYTRVPQGGNSFEYDVPVFSATSLANGPHNLEIRNGEIDGPRSLMLLDYITYTREVDTLTTSAQTQTTSSTAPSLSVTGNAKTEPSQDRTVSNPSNPSPSTKPITSTNPPNSTPIQEALASRSNKTRNVTIGVVVGLAVLSLLVVAFFLLRRRYKNRHPEQSATTPFYVLPSPGLEGRPNPPATQNPRGFDPRLFVQPKIRNSPSITRPAPTYPREHHLPQEDSDLPYLRNSSIPGQPPGGGGLHPQPSTGAEFSSIVQWQNRTLREAGSPVLPPQSPDGTGASPATFARSPMSPSRQLTVINR